MQTNRRTSVSIADVIKRASSQQLLQLNQLYLGVLALQTSLSSADHAGLLPSRPAKEIIATLKTLLTQLTGKAEDRAVIKQDIESLQAQLKTNADNAEVTRYLSHTIEDIDTRVKSQPPTPDAQSYLDQLRQGSRVTTTSKSSSRK